MHNYLLNSKKSSIFARFFPVGSDLRQKKAHIVPLAIEIGGSYLKVESWTLNAIRPNSSICPICSVEIHKTE